MLAMPSGKVGNVAIQNGLSGRQQKAIREDLPPPRTPVRERALYPGLKRES